MAKKSVATKEQFVSRLKDMLDFVDSTKHNITSCCPGRNDFIVVGGSEGSYGLLEYCIPCCELLEIKKNEGCPCIKYGEKEATRRALQVVKDASN